MSQAQDKSGATGELFAKIEAMVQTPGFSYENFESAELAKQERIIKAALEEFAEHDYAQVSTNTIVERAKISKGLLFHYFSSKAGLFCYLQKRVIQAMSDAVVDEVDISGGDIFEILRQATDAKMRVAIRLPLEVKFYVRSLLDTSVPSDVKSRIDENLDLAYDMLKLIITSIDDDLLKPGLDKEKVAKTVNLVCEGITREVIQELTPDTSLEFWNEKTQYVEDYYAFLRSLFYKEPPPDNI